MISSRVTLSVIAAAAALMMAGCDSRQAEPRAPQQASDTERAATGRTDTGRGDVAEAAVPQIDGKPIWSSNRTRTAQENAEAAFERNGQAFDARTVDDFVRKAHAFTSKPPRGTETIKRANGDTLLYDPKGNVFAVVTRDGAPRTMFKPDDGAAYWDEQKVRESARASGSGRDEG